MTCRLAFAALIAALAVPVAPPAFAQTPDPVASVRGRFQDATTRAAVPQVAVRLLAFSDTTLVHRATADTAGVFRIEGLAARSYWLEATRLGYGRLRQVIRIQRAGQDLGVLALTPESIPVSGVTVEESPAPATQKGDTTEYRAGAVKVHRDATAEDLVQKLPGVTMEGGQIKAHGETVQNVLVNGRPFFGNDPSAAMRNLPAEVVDRIQVYDRGSDLAEFSGFDDGTTQRTMNFILRDLKTQFGRVYGGYGDRDRYQSGGNATLVRGANRFTAIGMSNNINQKNFSHQDLFSSMSGASGGAGPRIFMMGGGAFHGRRGGGGGDHVTRVGGPGGGFGRGGGFDPSSFLVGQQAGISTTHSGGFNFSGDAGPTLKLSGSLFANDTDTENDQTLSRQFIPVQDSVAFYEQESVSDGRNRNQRFDARLEWSPDSMNTVVLQPRLYFQDTRTTSRGDAMNATPEGSPISDALSDTRENADGNNLSGRLTVRHRFGKRGRNVVAEVNAGHNLRDTEGDQYSLTRSFGDSASSDTLDQVSNGRTLVRSWSGRLAFTEPVASFLQLQAVWNPSLTRSESDARTFRLDPAGGGYTTTDSALSNSFRNRSTVQNGGLGALLRRGPWRLIGNLSYQETRLESEETWPGARTIARTFSELVPSATLTGSFANRRNLRLAWNTSSTPPGIGQLQNVVNNSNPLSLTTGNPNLRPSYTHSLSLRLSEADPATSKSRFLFANVSRTSNPIANSTFTAPHDVTMDGVFLARGTQLTRPVNLDESWSGNLFAVWSRPTKLLKSIVSLNGGGSWSRTPTELNGVVSDATSSAVRSGVVLSSNVSERLDFTVSYWGAWNMSRNSRSTTDGDYFSHNAALRLNSVVGPGIVLRQEVTHNLQSGVPSQYGQNLVLWNATVGKKFLKDQRGEIRITATDALQQDRSVSRSITETYVQDSRDRTLGRFVQAVFTYSFR